MQYIYYRKQVLTIPEEWSELSGKQLIKLATLLHSGNESALAKQKALQILSGKHPLFFLLLPLELRHRAEPFAQWVFGENKLTAQLLPKIKHLYGPDEDFGNLSMVEFHFTEVAYCNLVKTREPQYLDELIAVLYREPKLNYDHKINPEGDHRVAFGYGTMLWGRKVVAKWPAAYKLAVLLYYDGCRQSLIKSYPLVYPKNNKNKDSNQSEGLYRMMRTVSGDKYGTIPEVEKMAVHTCHLEITCMLEDNQRMKEEFDKMNKR